MSDDWESVVKIGKSVSRGGGGPRERVVKSQAELNAVRRSGAPIITEKKWGTAQSAGKGVDGQKISAIDRMNDTGPIEKASLTVAQRIRDARIAKFQNQDEFQKASGIPGPRIRQLELGTGGPPTNEEFNTMERVFEIYLRGKLIGQPKPQKGFKRNAGKETK